MRMKAQREKEIDAVLEWCANRGDVSTRNRVGDDGPNRWREAIGRLFRIRDQLVRAAARGEVPGKAARRSRLRVEELILDLFRDTQDDRKAETEVER